MAAALVWLWDKIPRRKYPMEVICGWCKEHMSWKKCLAPGKTSHGICEPCIKDYFPKAWKKLYGDEWK